MTLFYQNNNNKIIKTKNVLVGIRFDGDSREVLSWALVKVAEPGDSVLAIHVCRNSDHGLKKQSLLDDYLDVYQGLCSVKKVELSGQILIGSSVRKVLVREAKNYTDVTLVLGISKKSTFGSPRGSTSLGKYCAKRLSSSTDVLVVHNGKVLFTSSTSNQQPGLKGDPKPSLFNPREAQSEFGDSECDTETVISVCEPIRFSVDGSRRHVRNEDSRSESFGLANEERRGISRSASVLSTDSYYSYSSSMDQRPGWPLLRNSGSGLPRTPKHSRNVSVVQWVMSLPDRSPIQSLQCLTISEDSSLENETNGIVGDFDVNSKIKLASFSEVPQQGLQSLIQGNSFGCKWFSLDLLKASTCQFSSERLIGKGGCNQVYKGILPDGKPIAVKILNSSKQGWRDFALEFDIISSIKHKCIAPLVGVCIEDNALISVYDFLSKGNLEENLHGKDKEKDKLVLSWEVRYDIAVGIAEALCYLHKECPQQVIHRDIKSSNILLSDGFEPKLSDFGLAMWGPERSPFLTEADVVGTFGYLAPEYFMYGKVSDKIDVYAFGVVLLELLSGRRPIGSYISTAKGQESLVMWAKPKIEKGDVKGMLDPNLNGKIDEIQMHRMALAAALCITRSARLRPSIDEILKLLKGDEFFEKWASPKKINYQGESESHNDDENNINDDEVYPNSSAELHLGVAFNGVDDDSTSFSSSTDRSNTLSLEDYFKGRWSRSSSFD